MARRDEIVELVAGDLLGPANGPTEEVAESRVSDRYLVGLLAPLNRDLDPATDENVAEGGAGTAEEGSPEPGTAPVESTFPSSFGLTVCVAEEAKALRITARWGRYERRDSETRKNEKTGNPEKIWKRTTMEGVIASLALEEGPIEPRPPVTEQPEVVVQGLVRRRDEGWIVTLFLVNGQTEPERLKDEQWLFQPELVVESVGGEPIFVRRPMHWDPDRMEGEAYRESAEMAMLHRRHVEFGVGHGVAVHAEVAPGDPRRARQVATRVMSTYEVPQQTSPVPADPGFEALASVVFDMKRLAETPRDQLGVTLGPLVVSYRDWIARERGKVSESAEGLKEHE